MVDQIVTSEQGNTEDSNQKKVTIRGDISGERIRSSESELLEILKSMQEGMTLILELKEIIRIDSRGISLIVGLFKECTLRRLTLQINADNTAFRILTQVKLDRVLTIKEEN